MKRRATLRPQQRQRAGAAAIRGAGLLVCAAVMGGCGQKGPLVLPDGAPPATVPAAPAPQRGQDDSDDETAEDAAGDATDGG